MQKTIELWGWFHRHSGECFAVKFSEEESNEAFTTLAEKHPESNWPETVRVSKMTATYEDED